MTRQTIDYGIDLGTTNSEIACVDPGSRPMVIENNYNERITPSAIGYSNKGQQQVGKTAYRFFNSHRWEDVDNVHIEFKRRMGTDDTFLFPYTGKKYRAEFLSAEVLKELRASVERKRGEQIDAAVITIPAAFEQPQISATKKAAELAGFVTCELLQEPVAAALAYGFLETDAKGYWLVYDLGGGTFDVALLHLRDGIIRVANHCGDNYLGGKDIDNAILDRVILPQIAESLDLQDFNRGETRWKYAVAQIRYIAEAAKIELTKAPTAEIHIERIWDPIEEAWLDLNDFECELTREQVAPLYEAVFRKSLNYCKDVLTQSHLNPKDIEKLILVGGPTHYPLIREGLTSELGITLDFSQDPMTVVAQGAAVFAGTRRRKTNKQDKATPGIIPIELNYDPAGGDAEPSIGGVVKLPQGSNAIEFTVELVHTKRQWRSGKVKLAKNGAFLVAALANKGVNEYRIELCDLKGTSLKTDPETIVYSMIGLDVQAKTLTHNISLSQPDGTPYIVCKKGDTFPVRGTTTCKAAYTITKGSEESLIIKLFEGNNTHSASRNNDIGEVRVAAKDMPRDLPANAEIEVQIQLDENGEFYGTAEVMMFNMDEPYQITWLTKNIYENLPPQQLEKMAKVLRERVVSLRPLSAQDSLAADVFTRIDSEDTIAQIEETLQAARADGDQASKCHKLMLRLNEQLDDIEARQQRPELEKKAKHIKECAKAIVEQDSSGKYSDAYEQLSRELESAFKDADPHALVQATERLDDLIRYILSQGLEWWVKGFQYASENCKLMNDQTKAAMLFKQGRKAIDDEDKDSLKAAVIQLVRLLPKNAQNKSDEFGNVWV
jgi:molecular chaperone DnaK